jgi:hypothetical protein
MKNDLTTGAWQHNIGCPSISIVLLSTSDDGTAKHTGCNQMCYTDPRCQIQKKNLQSIVRDNCKHLSADQKKKLLQLLTKYESLFDGSLGDWKTKLVSFQLKEGVLPYHGRAFPVPKVHKETIIKEVERLCQLGVLERQPASEWASPSLIYLRKTKPNAS